MSYANTREHLFDELDLVDTILEAAKYSPDATEDRSGELDPDDEYDYALEPERLSLLLPDEVRTDIADHVDRIEERVADTPSTVDLRLRTLVERFGLSRNHLTVFVLAVAPDLDASYETVYQQLQDQSGAKRPTIGFIASLFGADSEQQAAATALVSPGSPLREYGFVEVSEPAGNSTSHRHRMLGVDPRLLSYLQGHDDIDPALKEIASVEPSDVRPADLRLDPGTHHRVRELASTASPDQRIYYFHGPDGSEKRRAVRALTEDGVLQADLDRLLAVEGLERFRREAILKDRPIHLTNAFEATDRIGNTRPADVPQEQRDRPTIETVIDSLSALERDIFLTGSEQWTPAPGALEATYSLLEFPKPGYELRRELWESYADQLADDVDVDAIANTFELTQGQIDGAIATARALTDSFDGDSPSHSHDGDSSSLDGDSSSLDGDSPETEDGDSPAGGGDAQGPLLSREAILEGCKAQSAEGLSNLAEGIEPEADWDDIVLPDATERQLRQVAAHIKQRGTVYEQWGFGDRFSRGKGVVALFAGPSGTGKTMAAEIIAADTGMAIFKIDLSSVVSKYIGETEENLERIFDAAKDSNAILLFDEADAVFGQRAGVSDATDRYANVEVNYLLQRIETYDGVVLLTSNYESHIDDAFMRRIHQTVSFRRPTEDVRDQIWRIMFPDATPLGDIDYDFLAELDLTGGNIRNVAQTAAVLAAESGDRVEMEHVVKAIRREYDKLEKLIDPEEFGEYKEHLGKIVEEPTEPEKPRRRRRPGVRQRRTDSDDAGPETPEDVIEAFVSRLSAGDREGLESLYHSKAIANELSRTDLQIHSRGDLSIESDFQRVVESRNRVVIRFTQQLNDQRMHIEYELRKESDTWRIYDFGQAGQRDAFSRQ